MTTELCLIMALIAAFFGLALLAGNLAPDEEPENATRANDAQRRLPMNAIPHRSLREALNHLREFPMVELHMTYLGLPQKLKAVFSGHGKGLDFTVHMGPQLLIGHTITIGIDGGESEAETSIDFHAGGFVVNRGKASVLVTYRNRRPWERRPTQPA
jgi:hypothetical protein